MSGSTFIEWLRAQAHRDDRVGDLARDVLADRSSHECVSHSDLMKYIADTYPNALPEVFGSLSHAAREWADDAQ